MTFLVARKRGRTLIKQTVSWTVYSRVAVSCPVLATLTLACMSPLQQLDAPNAPTRARTFSSCRSGLRTSP